MNNGSGVYAAPRHIEDPRDCNFYHVMDIPGHGNTQQEQFTQGGRAQWDLRGRIRNYTGGYDFTGKRVLDVGCASSFVSFELERLAREVVSFDAADGNSIHWLEVPGSDYVENYDKWLSQSSHWLDRIKNAYWFTHERLGSKNRVHYGSIYELPLALGRFDACFIAQVLIHLRDPIAALASVARLTDDALIVSETMVETDDPIAKFGYAKGRNAWKFWTLSRGFYREYLSVLGFEIESFTQNSYPVHPIGQPKQEWPVHTLVARRRG